MPMLKKSTREASSAARMAADGISTMMPETIRSAQGRRSARTAARASSRSERNSSTSPTVATIGAMT